MCLARPDAKEISVAHGLANAWLPVTDMSRAVNFYSQTLGLEVLQRDEAWSELDANGLRVGLNAREDESPARAGGAVVAFQPRGGLDGAVEELRGRAVEFVGEVSDRPWGRIARPPGSRRQRPPVR